MAPQSICRMCGRTFRNSKSLQLHTVAKGHVTRTMETSSTVHRTETKMQHVKPEYSYSVALVKAGQTLPEALLSKLVAENRTVISAGIRTKGAMEKEIFLPMKPTVEGTLEFMKKFMNGSKDFTRLVCFHSLPAEYDEDVEIMPWAPLKDSKGNPLLYVAAEGDFPKYVDDSADHYSEGSRLLVDWLGPQIETIYTKAAGNNPARLFEYLNSDEFGKNFAEQVGHRGVLTFLPITGPGFTVAKDNELGVSGDWGTASIAYGYTESVTAAATPAKVEAPKPVSKSKYVQDDDETIKVDPTPPAAPLQPGQEMVEEEIRVIPPKGMHGKTLKTWWRKSPVGDLPTNWRDDPHPGVIVKVKKAVAAAPEKKTDTAMAAAMKSAEIGKSMPIISGDKQKAFVEFVKKYVGDGSALITDPAVTAEQESKLAVFHELAGWKDLSEINRYTTAFLSTWSKEHPEATWLLIIEMRSEMNRLQKVISGLAEGNVKTGDLKTTPSTPVPDTVKPEVVPEKKIAGSKYL